MYNQKLFKNTITLLLALFLFLLCNNAFAQSEDTRWQEITEWIKMEAPELGFHPVGSHFRLSGRCDRSFYYGSPDGKFTINLPQWILNKPVRYLAPRTLSRRGSVNWTFQTADMDIRIEPKSDGKSLNTMFSRWRDFYQKEFVNRERGFRETTIVGDTIDWSKQITSPYSLEVKNKNYAEFRGKLLTLTSDAPIYVISGILQRDDDDPSVIWKKSNASVIRTIIAGFEFEIDGVEHYLTFKTSFRKNIHKDIRFPGNKRVDQLMTTLARNIQEAFGNRHDRELTDEQYNRVQKYISALITHAPALGYNYDYGEGKIGEVVALMGTVYRDPGRGRPVRLQKGEFVRLGDWIRTGADGRCRIVMHDRDGPRKSGPSIINMGTNSEMHFLTFELPSEAIEVRSLPVIDVIKRVGLLTGLIKVIFSKERPGDDTSFSVKAGVSICGIRGSEISIFHEPKKKKTQAYVLEGHMDVTNSETGESRSMTAHQKLTVNNGNVGAIQPMDQHTWDRLVTDHGLKIKNESSPAPASNSYDIPSLKASVKALRFFESPASKVPRDQRVYAKIFSKSKTRYINWELALQYPQAVQEKKFTIDVTWYRPDGSVFTKQSKNTKIKKNWKRSFHAHGRGWKDAGKWKPGKYRLVVSIAGKDIHEDEFIIKE